MQGKLQTPGQQLVGQRRLGHRAADVLASPRTQFGWRLSFHLAIADEGDIHLQRVGWPQDEDIGKKAMTGSISVLARGIRWSFVVGVGGEVVITHSAGDVSSCEPGTVMLSASRLSGFSGGGIGQDWDIEAVGVGGGGGIGQDWDIEAVCRRREPRLSAGIVGCNSSTGARSAASRASMVRRRSETASCTEGSFTFARMLSAVARAWKRSSMPRYVDTSSRNPLLRHVTCSYEASIKVNKACSQRSKDSALNARSLVEILGFGSCTSSKFDKGLRRSSEAVSCNHLIARDPCVPKFGSSSVSLGWQGRTSRVPRVRASVSCPNR